MIKLNDDQSTAMAQILAAFEAGETRHVLTGAAGTGKTSLVQTLVREFKRRKVSVCVTAPTHKAVAVLARKLSDAGLCDIEAMTIHALLGLTVSQHEETTILKRGAPSQARRYRVVVIDESSMNSADLCDFIDNDLKQQFVLFVGDAAQLPPVGETETRCFGVRSKSHLSHIVRQEAGNPIIQAAQMIRERQDTTPDWSWTMPAEAGPIGIYRAGDNADEWMRDAFTSEAFAADNDAFRYICYTNARVAQVNAKVRSWIYGQTSTPFVAGERAICRSPILDSDGHLALSVNEEATVASVDAANLQFDFASHPASRTSKELAGWSVTLPVWRVRFVGEQNKIIHCDITQNARQYDAITRRAIAEAKANRSRWWDYYRVKEKLTTLQHVYAMTAHTSQGSTFGCCFIDIADIRKRELFAPKECQQLAYVALTRASQAAIIIGAP